MSYSKQDVEKLFQELLSFSQNILTGVTNGGTTGETVLVSLSTPYQGQMSLTGVTIQDCPPGECLALNDGSTWYVVSKNSDLITNESIIRLRKFRDIDEKSSKNKMAILYTSRSDEVEKCSCPKFSDEKGKCKESCVSGPYSSLEECQSRSNLWTVYMSAGVDNWHRVNYASRYYPDIKATFDIYPDNRRNKPEFASIIYDIPYDRFTTPPYRESGEFLYKLTGVSPNFSVSISFVGSIRWHGEEDLKAVNYSSYIYMWKKDSRDYKNTSDPYSLYKRLTDLYVLSPTAYRYYANIDDSYPKGYYEPVLTSFAEGGYEKPFMGMMMVVEPKDVKRGLNFFNTMLGSRLGGNALKIDYVLDKYRQPIKDYNSLPPPPPYEPNDKGKLYFLLGGDRSKPLRLPFSLSKSDNYVAFLSVVNRKKIVTIKHGYEENGKYCKITTIEINQKNNIKIKTTKNPGPVTPILDEWRHPLIYNFSPEGLSLNELKCSYSYWSASTKNIASKLTSYPWNGEKASFYDFDITSKNFSNDILLRNVEIDYDLVSTKWQPAQTICRSKSKKFKRQIKVLRLLTHENIATVAKASKIIILACAIYSSR